MSEGELSNVEYIHEDRAVPEMTVFELLVGRAISRNGPRSTRELLALLTEWCQRPISGLDLDLALERMAERGLVDRAGSEDRAGLTDRGIEQVSMLCTATIRMSEGGMALLRAGLLINMVEIMGKDL
jgi:hypothetical protein